MDIVLTAWCVPFKKGHIHLRKITFNSGIFFSSSSYLHIRNQSYSMEQGALYMAEKNNQEKATKNNCKTIS